jgi:predicted DNA binding CopG/RHH family protein
MTTKTKIKAPKLDAFEKEILDSFESGVLEPVGTKSSFAKYRAAAKASASKDKRINIRLSSPDLKGLQVRALEEGLPYQTLIASVLHKYVSGRLVESK